MSDKQIEFFAHERVPGENPAREQAELDALAARLKLKTDADKYRSTHRVNYEPPGDRGYTTIDVLQDLWGMPLCDLVMGYVHSLRPSCIRVTPGMMTIDAVRWRVTVEVDKDDRVKRIFQEVEVGYACGYDLELIKRAMKGGDPPRAFSGCIGNTGGLRIDFS